MNSTIRIKELKRRMLDEDRYVSIEQALLITESYKTTEDEAVIIRRAKAFAKACEEIKINIDPLELIVGNRSAGVRAGIVFPESGLQWLKKEIKNLEHREQDKFKVKDQDIKAFYDELLSYWEGKSLEDNIKSGEEGSIISEIEKVVKVNQKDHAQGHILPNVPEWLEKGPAGLLQRVSQLVAETEDEDKKTFYRSQQIVLKASITFMQRYAKLARELADDPENKANKDNLQQIATICDKLSSSPATTFHEALQSLWLLFVLLHLESNASSFSPGRMDQYLWPYYQKDRANGTLTKESALELIEAIWLKFNQIVYLRNAHSARFFAGFPIGFNIAIGGQKEDGSCAVNELSYLMLEAQDHIGLPQPNLSARLYKGAPFEFIKACSKVIGKGSGMPQIFNDEAIIPALKNQDISHEHAMDYGVVGCVELSTQGNYLGWSDAAMFNMVKIIELTINDGVCQLTGNQLGLKTGHLADYGTYEDFEIALEKQMNFFIDKMMAMCAFVDRKHAELLPSPFLSSVIDDCIEKGLDVTAGGAHYNLSGIQFIQASNVADCLAVIKQAVFENKTIEAHVLRRALSENYEGEEELRQRLLTKTPKYGNDIEWVDNLGLKWVEIFSTKISTYTNVRGGKCHTGLYTVSAHIPMGANVAATPDGRLSNEPLADGGLSAVYGRDINGPTALLKSVSRINSMYGSNGTLLNMKFLPGVFETEEGIEKFAYLLKSFVELNITHVQFNVVTEKDLLNAQKHPEQYKNLTIRVAGYTAFFIELAEDLQNEIIERTVYSEI